MLSQVYLKAHELVLKPKDTKKWCDIMQHNGTALQITII